MKDGAVDEARFGAAFLRGGVWIADSAAVS
jgi:hypothetical protein